MAKDLLLEIGTEEVPAHVMPGVLAQLKERAEKAFQENRIAFASVRTLGTPRRTALVDDGEHRVEQSGVAVPEFDQL